ncbi:MAG: glycolate oxidase subunit GlcE [Pseudomonadota bacterium]|nr:glycolate oxidase subunit GlcE [Pseudomonadota bacterium]
MSDNQADNLLDLVRAARESGKTLEIRGSGSKRFLGRTPKGEPLDVTGHKGIASYQPKELVITARAGTSMEEIEAALAEQGQMLAFEPPRFGAGATLGGTIATGLSGPARPYAGSARDFVLGTRVLTGRGQVLRFGGEVMKNVAGYDVSRLMTGAYGTLGLLLEVSLKVMPRPAAEHTLAHERSLSETVRIMNEWAGSPLPITASCHDGDRLYIRLSGAGAAVKQAASRVGGESVDEGGEFWRMKIREQGHGFFAGDGPLWRLSLPAATPPLDLPGKWLVEWGGAQRWLRGDADPEAVRDAAAAAGGHASLFRGGDREGEVFHPLAPPLMSIHRKLKQAFDPQGIFNPGRLYPEL